MIVFLFDVNGVMAYHILFFPEEMIRGLQQLGWKKVDVSFHSSYWPFFAHNNIHVRLRLLSLFYSPFILLLANLNVVLNSGEKQMALQCRCRCRYSCCRHPQATRTVFIRHCSSELVAVSSRV